MRREPARPSYRSYENIAIISVLLLASTYCVVFAIGPSNLGDDVSYSWLAHWVSIGTYQENGGSILSIRPLQIIPIGIFYYLFGSGVYQSSAYDSISFVLTVFLTYLIGKELYNWKVGTLSAFFMAIFPLAAIHAVTMSDNIPLMFFATFAIFAFIKGIKTKKEKWYVLSGVLTCACGFIMPEGFMFWIVMFVMLLWQIRINGFNSKNLYIHGIIGFIAMFAVMLFFNYLNSGNAIITFTSTASYYSNLTRPDLLPPPISESLIYYPSVMFPYEFSFHPSQLPNDLSTLISTTGQPINKVGIFFYLVIPAFAYLLYRKDSKMLIPGMWFVAGLFLLEFTPMYVGLNPPYIALAHRLDRYLTLIGPSLCLILSAAILEIVRSSKNRFKNTKAIILGIGVVIIAATSFATISFWQQVMIDSRYTELAMAGVLGSLPSNTPIYFDAGLGNIATYMNFENLSRFYGNYNNIRNCEGFPVGAYVVVPRYVFDGFNFTPDQEVRCNNWNETLSPQLPYNNSTVAASVTSVADLFYVSSNSITLNQG